MVAVPALPGCSLLAEYGLGNLQIETLMQCEDLPGFNFLTARQPLALQNCSRWQHTHMQSDHQTAGGATDHCLNLKASSGPSGMMLLPLRPK